MKKKTHISANSEGSRFSVNSLHFYNNVTATYDLSGYRTNLFKRDEVADPESSFSSDGQKACPDNIQRNKVALAQGAARDDTTECGKS